MGMPAENKDAFGKDSSASIKDRTIAPKPCEHSVRCIQTSGLMTGLFEKAILAMQHNRHKQQT
jgi:hypothetical protein